MAPQPPWKPHNKIITKWIFTQLRRTTTTTTMGEEGSRTECGRVAIETMVLHCIFFAACAHNVKETQTSRKKTVVIFSINSVWTCVYELGCCCCRCYCLYVWMNTSNKREVVTHHHLLLHSIHLYQTTWLRTNIIWVSIRLLELFINSMHIKIGKAGSLKIVREKFASADTTLAARMKCSLSTCKCCV